MKISEICRGGFFTATELRLLEGLGYMRASEILRRLRIGSESELTDISDELERRRRQRRKKRLIPAGPGGIGSPPPRDTAIAPAEAPAADAAGPAPGTPVGSGGTTIV